MNRRQADRLCQQIARRGKTVALARPAVVEDAGRLTVVARDIASGRVYTVPDGVTTWRELRQRLIAESDVRSE